jgi:alanyl-tRNA synthetase
MNQYVGFLNEKLTPPACFKNIVNSQVCVRLGGKLNDLSLVGLDHTHQTSFTMLGNWSISNYFKKTSTNLTFSLLNM